QLSETAPSTAPSAGLLMPSLEPEENQPALPNRGGGKLLVAFAFLVLIFSGGIATGYWLHDVANPRSPQKASAADSPSPRPTDQTPPSQTPPNERQAHPDRTAAPEAQEAQFDVRDLSRTAKWISFRTNQFDGDLNPLRRDAAIETLNKELA